MATRFSQIVAAVKAQLDLDWPGNVVTFAEGIKTRSENAAPNRVVWVRIGGTVRPVDGIGPGLHASEVTPSTEVASISILTDVYSVEADVWGQDEDTADAIRVAVIRAAHKTASNRSIQAEGWIDLTEAEGTAAYNNLGAKHRIVLSFAVPIRGAEELPLALVLETPTTEAFVTRAAMTTIEHELDLTSPP